MTTVEAPGMVVLFPGPLRNEQYFALPESNLHIELFEGHVIMAPSPAPLHQRIILRIARSLDEYAREHGGEAIVAPLDVELEEGHIYQPDVLYLAPGQEGLVASHILGAPALVVEVLSPGTRSYDLQDKAPVYARAGVREMWIVDPAARQVSVYTNEGEQFGQPSVVQFGEHLPSKLVQVGMAGLDEL